MFKQIFLLKKVYLITCIAFLQSFGLKYPLNILAHSSSPFSTSSVNIVEDSQLEKFAKTVKNLQIIDRLTQSEMLKTIEAIEMSPEEFIRVGQQKKDKRNLDLEKQVKFEETLDIVRKINEKDRLKKQEAIKKEGLEVSQFNKIGKIVEQNIELQKKVVKTLNNLSSP